MGKISFLVLLAVFFLLTPAIPVLAQGIYQWVDEKGTVHFSDNPASPIFDKREKKPTDENSIEIAGRLAIGNRRVSKEEMDHYYHGIKVPVTSGQRGASSSTGSRTPSRPVRRS